MIRFSLATVLVILIPFALLGVIRLARESKELLPAMVVTERASGPYQSGKYGRRTFFRLQTPESRKCQLQVMLTSAALSFDSLLRWATTRPMTAETISCRPPLSGGQFL
jgi:hypothetical protein